MEYVKNRKWCLVMLTVIVILACLAGCDREVEPHRTAPKETISQGITGEVSDNLSGKNAVEYNHCGLHIVLDDSYTAQISAASPEYFSFDNGRIQGAVAFGPKPTCPDGSTIENSYHLAQYLSESVSDHYRLWVGKTANGFYYTEIHGEHYKMVRGLFTQRNMSWNFWLRCDAKTNLIEQMVQVLADAWIAESEVPYLPQEPSPAAELTVIEFKGLLLELESTDVEIQAYDYFANFTSNDVRGNIQWRSIYSFPDGVDTVQEIAERAQGTGLDSWEHVELSSEGGMERLLLYNDGYHDGKYYGTVFGYFLKNKLCWTVEVKGDDCDTLVKFVSSGVVDDFGYYREMRYDINNYSSINDIFQELDAAGCGKWGRYTVIVNGLVSPVTFEMFGPQIEAVSAFGRRMEVTGVSLSSDTDGISYAALGECTGAIWLNVIYGDLDDSRIWTFTLNKCAEYQVPESEAVVLYHNTDGGFGFRQYSLRFGNMVNQSDFDPLEWAVSRDEICYEEGRADIWCEQLELKPGESYTISELYDMDALFQAAKEEGRFGEYRNLEELLESNVMCYPN